jgi:hypothetical protein
VRELIHAGSLNYPANRAGHWGDGGEMRVLRLVIVTAVAMGALTAGSASAAAPEFGRCLKLATKSLSNFDNAKCVKVASEDAGTEAEKLKKGNYQWFPGVVNNKFTTELEPGTLFTLETLGGSKLTCKGETSTGEYTSPTEVGKVVIDLTACEARIECESKGAGGGHIVTAPLAGSLGYETITEDTPAKDHIALELHAEDGGNIAEFHCAGLFSVVRGSVLHRITANAMKLTATDNFAAAKGKQKPEHFAGGLPGEHILEINTSGGPFEQTGLRFKALLTNEEKVEASTVN